MEIRGGGEVVEGGGANDEPVSNGLTHTFFLRSCVVLQDACVWCLTSQKKIKKNGVPSD